MLTIVIENPMLFTSVSEVPLDSGGALLATNVENNGESATTEKPQINRKIRNKSKEEFSRKNGETKQHIPETPNANEASFLVPIFRLNIPAKTQAIVPIPKIENDQKGMFKAVSGYFVA